MYIKRIILVFIIGLFFWGKAFCGIVDTAYVYSNAMHKKIPCVIILPERSDIISDVNYPVVYLLHGYSGNYMRWLNRDPDLKDYADKYDLIIVCPDGGYDSWYLDSPIDSAVRYQTFLTKELVPYVDKHYPTMQSGASRGICGDSMGGYGALFTAISHPNEFGVVVSISGCVEISAFANKFGLESLLGDISTHSDTWENFEIMNMVNSLHNRRLMISLSCGINDIFIAANRRLHKKLQRLGIDHSYTEREGSHNWDYWRNAIEYQLLFCHRSFAQPGKNKNIYKYNK